MKWFLIIARMAAPLVVWFSVLYALQDESPDIQMKGLVIACAWFIYMRLCDIHSSQ